MIRDLTNEAFRKLSLSNYSEHTIISYIDWIHRYLFYSRASSADELSNKTISDFITFLSRDCHISPSSVKQASSAVKYLHVQVLGRKIIDYKGLKIRIRNIGPVILTKAELRMVMGRLVGQDYLIAGLIYGTGLSVSECVRLKLKDIDGPRNLITTRSQKSSVFRKVIIPETLAVPLDQHIRMLKETFKKHGPIEGMQHAAGEIFLFPHPVLSGNKSFEFSRHLSESHFQKAFKQVMQKEGLNPRATCYSLRHSFAVHLLESGVALKELQKILGHKDIRSTRIYKRMITNRQAFFKSPVDLLFRQDD